MGITMECKEFEKLIPDFIDHKLDYKTLNQFNQHRKQCENCKEELVIRFLMTEGLQRLEEGDAFDLQKELDRYMQDTEKKIKSHRTVLVSLGAVILCSILILAGAILWLLLGGFWG